MADKTFNLLDEPWIKVIYPNCKEDEVSLKQVFAKAHEYTDLAGEMPTQNVAMLRLLLAVLHAVFYRADENGNSAEITNAGAAYGRWKALWELGQFPTEPINAYLEKWRDRFDLLDEKRPFYQVPDVKNFPTKQNEKKRGYYTAAKLNGELSESENKKRLFTNISGEEKSALSYSEAASWLLYVNAFDDMAIKRTKNADETENQTEDKLTAKVAWVGQLGNILAIGNNLFETLMLNFVLLDENNEPWEGCSPVWERDEVDSKELVLVAQPKNQAELLTLQSRKIMLNAEHDKIVGYSIVYGNQFDNIDAFTEQMTVWEKKKGKNKVTEFQPKQHDRNRKMWQDFSAIASFDNTSRAIGVVDWNRRLSERKAYNNDLICYRFVGARYDVSMQSAITDTFEDSLSFHLNLLSELNRAWISNITKEIEICEEFAKAVGRLAFNLDIASGGTKRNKDNKSGTAENREKEAKEQFYYRIDVPFRSWLRELDANQSDVERNAKISEWRDTAYKIADTLGQELVNASGPMAFRGKAKDESNYYCAPQAYNSFRYSINMVKKGGK